jgi:micrococcal nuclease
MSRHWRPDGKIVRIRPVRQPGPWGSAGDYVPGTGGVSRRCLLTLLAGAVAVGLAAGVASNWTDRRTDTAPTAAIEWNAVQEVPTRTPDAEDVEWQKRAEELDVAAANEPDEAVSSGLPPASRARGHITVIDGDTFAMGGQRIRIAGIDAPETHPSRCADEARLGFAATQKLKQLLGSGRVTLSGAIHDKYGRDVRQVQVGGRDVGEIMIGAGLARSYDGAKRQPWC